MTVSDEIVLCPECGLENAAGAAVCQACGAILLGKPKGRTGQRTPNSTLSILTVVLAALGLVTVGLTAVLALPVGIAAMVQLAARKGQLRGWPLAIGGTSLAALVAGMAIYGAWTHESVAATKSQCLANVKNIADALSMYAADYGAFPPADEWQSRSLKGYYTPRGKDVYVCPVAPKLRSGYAYNAALDALPSDALSDAGRTVSVFESDRGWNAAGGEDLIPAKARHRGGDNLGFADGHVRWFLRSRQDPRDRDSWLKRYAVDDEGYLVWQPSALPARPSRNP